MEIFTKLFEMQDSVNKATIGENWKEGNEDWRLAIMQESAELIDSFNWKWWKKGMDDIANAKIEVVDILHFAMSFWMKQHQGQGVNMELRDFCLNALQGGLKSGRDTVSVLKDITCAASNPYQNELDIFASLMFAAGRLKMSFADIAKIYFGKAVLNKFRQSNGYAEGTYRKKWGRYDVEDNKVMLKLLENIELSESFEEDLLGLLKIEYLTI